MRGISVFRNTDCAGTPKKGFASMNMVRPVVRRSVMIATLLIAVAGAARAQVPTRTQIQFDITVAFALTLGGSYLAPGHYVLHQDNQNPNLFRLYWHDLAREPVAVIYAIRGRHLERRLGGTRVEMDVEESGDASQPVLRGFKVPYDDPWEVISVLVNNRALMERLK